MFRIGFFLTLFFCGLLCAENVKQTITTTHLLLDKGSNEDRGAIERDLAIAYYRDQNHAAAFKTFLSALDHAKKFAQPSLSESEKQLYDQALALYLSQEAHRSVQSTAKKISSQFTDEMAKHADYHLLAYIVSAAYANLNQYDQFFEQFFRSYQYYPTHFIAYKTKAILLVKLSNLSTEQKEREFYRDEAIEQLKLAIAAYPQDVSLYKMILFTAPASKKGELIRSYLYKIIDENIIIPRSDLMFYTEQAIQNGTVELAQRFVHKASEWYQQSRSVAASQEFIDHYIKSRK